MSDSTALATRPESAAVTLWNDEQKRILKNLVAKDASDVELSLFGEMASRTGLDPFTKQIYCIVRGTGNNRSVTFQTGIDGYRLVAQRSGEYAGQDGPYWCGDDGAWRDVWLSKEPPAAARVGIYRKGFPAPLYAVARYDEYVQVTQEWVNGQRTGRTSPNSMWAKMPANQLAKCAEALALRKAFPNELSGIYSREEMAQAENDVIDVTPTVVTTPGGDTVNATTGEYVDPPAPQGQRGNTGGTRAAARAAAQQKAGEMDKPVIHKSEEPPAEPQSLRERMGVPPPAAGSPDPWMNELRKQLEAWKEDGVLAPICAPEAKATSVLAEWVGTPVTVSGMRQWAAALAEGQDPYRTLIDLVRGKLAAAAQQVVGPEEGSDATPVDDLPFE